MLKLRPSYFGHWEGHVVNASKSLLPTDEQMITLEGEFVLPDTAYNGTIPVRLEKYKDLQDLKMFCGKEAREFFGRLLKMEPGEKRKKKKNRQ
ncbi:hypothetical protein J6590_069572 [Homalodisca vitripennis]|nr:hypothetical protein J6590_069572 [Homalodisca vitripennis]